MRYLALTKYKWTQNTFYGKIFIGAIMPRFSIIGACMSEVLAIGSNDPNVGLVQTALNAKGANLTVDNDFGPGTQAALIQFQQSVGLTPDGQVTVGGTETWAALGLAAPQANLLGTSPANMMALFNTAVIPSAHVQETKETAEKILGNQSRYKTVATEFGCPWWVVGCLHSLESSLSFRTFLANGDPLFNSSGVGLKTVHVPAGLGPFKSWEDAAIASLQHEGWKKGMPWDIGSCLMSMRAYNGRAYEAYHNTNTPYVWSYTNHYTVGKFVADGTWDASAVSQEPGCAALMLGLQTLGIML